MIPVFPTLYGGRTYRSRTEARWAIFFDSAKIRFDYEPEGFLIRTGGYLPDFHLTQVDIFFEVKGREPGADEQAKCRELAIAAECNVILAIGSPEPAPQLILYDDDGQRGFRYYFAQDRDPAFGFWLTDGAGDDIRIGPNRAIHGVPLGPSITSDLARAYVAARDFRFDGHIQPQEPNR